jgi:hypothetical protein
MAKRPKGQKRPAEIVSNAVHVMRVRGGGFLGEREERAG